MLNQWQVNGVAQVRLRLNEVNHHLVFGTVRVGGKEDLVGDRFAAQIQEAQPQRAARLDMDGMFRIQWTDC
jgi:hypothetical protein